MLSIIRQALALLKSLLRPAIGYVKERKPTKNAEFGYLVTKFINSAAQGSHDGCVVWSVEVATPGHFLKVVVFHRFLYHLKDRNESFPEQFLF